MAPYLLQIFIFYVLFTTIHCNYVYQYPAKQYPQQTYSPLPPSYSKSLTPEYKTYPSYQPYQPVQANFVHPKPVEPIPKPCPKPKPEPIPEPVLPIVPSPPIDVKKPGFDSNVLNNLAIALQLLIVSNIISNPPSELNTASLSDAFPTIPCNEYDKVPLKSIMDAMPDLQRMTPPNSKFLGETDVMSLSNFGSFPKPSPRPGGLMSPYEAMNNNILEMPKYNSKKDFQSPYSAILAFDNNKDLFSMSDIFI